MSKNKNNHKKYATQEAFESLENTAKSSEHFLEKNAKLLGIIFGVIIVGVVGYFAYLKFIVEPKNQEAEKEIVTANEMFAQDSLNLALNGSPGAFMGYNEIINEYGGTNVANLAKFKAGVASYREGKYQEALDYFQDFSTKEIAMKAVREGAIGDAYSQLGKKDEALSSYIKASKATGLQVLQATYAKKAAILALELQKYDGAIELLTAYTQEYDDQLQGGEIERLLTLLNNAKQ